MQLGIPNEFAPIPLSPLQIVQPVLLVHAMHLNKQPKKYKILLT